MLATSMASNEGPGMEFWLEEETSPTRPEAGVADFAFAFGEKARFRVSVLKSKANYGMVLRQRP